MQGWAVPPPKEPKKSREEFRKEREKMEKYGVRYMK
jgi:hypothetical protein